MAPIVDLPREETFNFLYWVTLAFWEKLFWSWIIKVKTGNHFLKISNKCRLRFIEKRWIALELKSSSSPYWKKPISFPCFFKSLFCETRHTFSNLGLGPLCFHLRQGMSTKRRVGKFTFFEAVVVSFLKLSSMSENLQHI